MLTTLVINLFLATILHAESTTPPISSSTTAASVNSTGLFAEDTTSSSPFDIDSEIAKLAATCLTKREHELLSGDILKYKFASLVNTILVLEAQEVIGLEELRAVLGFAPLGPWTSYREPSEDEIAAAPTIEAYYELKEPRSEDRSLDSERFYEKNFPPAITFLDKRLPSIRTIYRRKLEEIRRRPDAKVTIDRKEVDLVIDEFITICKRVHNAIYFWSPCRRRASQ